MEAEFRAAGVTVWAISPQTVSANAGLKKRRELPFPVLADNDQSVIRAWGLFNDDDHKGRAIPYPAAYVVAPDGTVTWRHVSQGTRDRPTAGELLAAARSASQRREEV